MTSSIIVTARLELFVVFLGVRMPFPTLHKLKLLLNPYRHKKLEGEFNVRKSDIVFSRTTPLYFGRTLLVVLKMCCSKRRDLSTWPKINILFQFYLLPYLALDLY